MNANRPDDNFIPPNAFAPNAKPPKLPFYHDPASARLHAEGCKSAASIFSKLLEERRAAIDVAGDVKGRLMAQGFVAIMEVEIEHEKQEAELYSMLARDPAGLLRHLAKRGAR